jgi:hypothetical protein
MGLGNGAGERADRAEGRLAGRAQEARFKPRRVERKSKAGLIGLTIATPLRRGP